jgi:hypothetical protein
MPSQPRFSMVESASEVVVRRVYALPPSAEVDELRARADELLRRARTWRRTLPPAREREDLMKLLLELYVEITRTERRSPARPPASCEAPADTRSRIA